MRNKLSVYISVGMILFVLYSLQFIFPSIGFFKLFSIKVCISTFIMNIAWTLIGATSFNTNDRLILITLYTILHTLIYFIFFII